MVDKLIIATSTQEALKAKSENAGKSEKEKRKTAFLAGGTEINRLGSTVEADTLISIGRLKELFTHSRKERIILVSVMFQIFSNLSCLKDFLRRIS